MDQQPTPREILIATVGLSLCGWVVLVSLAWCVWHMLDAGVR